MSVLQGLCFKCRFCLRVVLEKEKNEKFHLKYNFMIVSDFDFMILRFSACFLCLIYNFHFFNVWKSM